MADQTNLYDFDILLWAEQQGEMLRRRRQQPAAQRQPAEIVARPLDPAYWRRALADPELRRQVEKIHFALTYPELFEALEKKASQASGDAAPGARKNADITRLQAELDAAHAKIRRLERGEGDSLLISRRDSADDIATVLQLEIPAKTATIAAAVLNRQKSTAPRAKRQGKLHEVING